MTLTAFLRRHWRLLTATCILLAFFAPWMSSCSYVPSQPEVIYKQSNCMKPPWVSSCGNYSSDHPFYLTGFNPPLPSDSPSPDPNGPGPGYISPDFYIGWEVLVIFGIVAMYLPISVFFPTLFFFPMVPGAILALLYALLSLTAVLKPFSTWLNFLRKGTLILGLLFLGWTFFQVIDVAMPEPWTWHNIGLVLTGILMLVCAVFEFRKNPAPPGGNAKQFATAESLSGRKSREKRLSRPLSEQLVAPLKHRVEAATDWLIQP